MFSDWLGMLMGSRDEARQAQEAGAAIAERCKRCAEGIAVTAKCVEEDGAEDPDNWFDVVGAMYMEPGPCDPVKSPNHYTWIPGIECKEVSKHFSSMAGQAIQYVWRHGYKGTPVKDLRKAVECLEIEIERLEARR